MTTSFKILFSILFTNSCYIVPLMASLPTQIQPDTGVVGEIVER